ncbi:hypothetical protein CR513_62568, partial [Mucuna pruriens]
MLYTVVDVEASYNSISLGEPDSLLDERNLVISRRASFKPLDMKRLLDELNTFRRTQHLQAHSMDDDFFWMMEGIDLL